MAPTRRTAWALAAVAAASFFVSDLLALMGVVAVVVAAAADGWAIRNSHDATRTVSDVLSRGVPAPVEIKVGRPGATTVVRQPASPDLRVDVLSQGQGLRASVTPMRRGHHVLAPPVLRVRGSLGLAQWTRPVGEALQVKVFPDMPAARLIASQVRHNLFQLDGLRIRGALGLGTAFDSLRDYVDGDDVRRVNWLATARHPTPMVNQYRIEQDRDVICVIDCGRLMGAPIGSLSRLDAAVDAAATIGAVADVVGDRVGVVAFDRDVLRDLRPMRRGGEALAEAIFDLEPSTHESSYHLVFERVAGAKRAFVLVLTDLLDLAAARPLAEAIPALGRKHEVAVASVIDPDLTGALTELPTSRQDAARALVATDVLGARREAVAAVRRHGARVVDAPQASFSAACVGAYLEAKARVRI